MLEASCVTAGLDLGDVRELPKEIFRGALVGLSEPSSEQ